MLKIHLNQLGLLVLRWSLFTSELVLAVLVNLVLDSECFIVATVMRNVRPQ